jgi:hypothetical protein
MESGMPIENIALFSTNAGQVDLHHFDHTVAVRLHLGNLDAGKLVVFGRVVMQNDDNDAQNAGVMMTTADEAVTLDRADFRIAGKGDSQVVSLQAAVSLPLHGQIIDIRCGTFNGVAREASLIAIQVDGLRDSSK